MNLLMVDSEATWRGGEGQLALLMRGLKAAGAQITLASPPGSAIERVAKEFGVTCLPLSIAGGFDLGAAWKLRGYLREGRYDIVHTHSSHAHSAAFLADRMSRPRGRSDRARLVVSRRVDFKVAANGFSALKYRRGADVYVAISEGVRKVLLGGNIEPERIALVRSGIDLEKFNDVANPEYLRREFAIADGAPVVGNVAALAPHKSQVDFIDAAARVLERVPGARFFIVGEGELRGQLEKRIAELGLDGRVTLTGFRKDVLEFIALFDCFVLSSYLEGLCTSIMDAQALGTPVVATDTGGVPDLVDNGKTGLLVTPRDPGGLADAIVKMLEERELAVSLADNARRRASESYDCRHMVEGTIAVYRTVLGRNGSVQ